MPHHRALIPTSRRRILMMMLMAGSLAVLLLVPVPYYSRTTGPHRVEAGVRITTILGDLVGVEDDVIKLTRSASNATEDANFGEQCYGPIDKGQLTANFAQLTEVVSATVDPFLAAMTSSGPEGGRRSAKSLMRVTRPLVNCSSWQLTSPSGRRRYTRQDLLNLARRDDEDNDIIASDAEASIPPLLPVPNVAHFVLPFADQRLRFHHLVSILSCAWLMRPRLLFLWHAANRLPVGQNWQLLRQNLTAAVGDFWESRVVLASRDLPTSVYGARVAVPEHQSDVMRLEAVLAFGGAYFDLDVLVLRRLEPLRRFPFVIGRQTSVGLCNGAFLAEPGNQMLAMWHLAYQTFDDRWWALHSVNLPQSLCTGGTGGLTGGFPQLCHIEPESMQKPAWTPDELPWIYGPRRVWNWRARNYMVHLWYRHHRVEYNFTSVRQVDSMLGDMLRFVLFGSEAVAT